MFLPNVRECFKEQLRPSVEKGAAYLDEFHPGWASKIIPDTLNMYHGDRCICAVMFGSFCDRPMDLQDGALFGFNIPENDSYGPGGGSRFAFKVLDELWLN